MTKSIVKQPKYIVILLVAVLLSLTLNLYQFSHRDHLNGYQLHQAAYAYIAKDCHEKVRTEGPNLDCSHIDVGEPSYIEGGLFDPNLWTVSAVASYKGGELVWFIELNPTGKIVKSELMYTDSTGKEIESKMN